MNNKALEQKLAENEKLLSTVIQTLPVAVFCKDIRKNFQWSLWNKKAEELFGIKVIRVSSVAKQFPVRKAGRQESPAQAR